MLIGGDMLSVFYATLNSRFWIMMFHWFISSNCFALAMIMLFPQQWWYNVTLPHCTCAWWHRCPAVFVDVWRMASGFVRKNWKMVFQPGRAFIFVLGVPGYRFSWPRQSWRGSFSHLQISEKGEPGRNGEHPSGFCERLYSVITSWGFIYLLVTWCLAVCPLVVCFSFFRHTGFLLRAFKTGSLFTDFTAFWYYSKEELVRSVCLSHP